jgi:hypothetical protein
MKLSEKILVYETVIAALKNRTDMAAVLSSFPLDQQLEAIRFMEFMGSDLHATTDGNSDLQ